MNAVLVKSNWLELLHETNYLAQTEFQSIYHDNKELTKLLTAIINTIKQSSTD